MKKPYIAGSISDGGAIADMEIRRENEQRFHDAEAELRGHGFDPINPAREEGREDCESWLDFMRASLRDISHCDGIATLENVEQSTGAMIEVRLARDLGLPVANVDTWVITGGEF